MTGPFYPGEVTITLPRGLATKLHRLVGTRPLSDIWAREVHNTLVAELDKTVDDFQHEKLEAATRAVQEQEFIFRSTPVPPPMPAGIGDVARAPQHVSTTTIVNNTVVPADIHVHGEAADIGIGAGWSEPLTNEQVAKLKKFGLTRDWTAECRDDSTVVMPSDPVDGADPDDIARAVYEMMQRKGVPLLGRQKFEFCREIVALVRSHLPEDQPQPAKGKVLLEISHHTAAYIKRMAEDRVERYPFRLPFTEALIMEIEAALGEKS